MAYCRSCGKPLEGDEKFCSYCGGAVAQAEAITPPVATPGASAEPVAGEAPLVGEAPTAGAAPVSAYQQVPAYPPPPYPPASGYHAPPGYPAGAWSQPLPRRSRKGLLIGLAAVVVVAAIACVLVFVVFAGGDAAATPEQTVKRLFTAMEDKDADAVLKLMDPQMIKTLPTGDDLNAFKEQLSQNMFDYESVKFSGLKMSTEMTGDTTATVTVTGGKATATDSSGQTKVEDVTEAGAPVSVDLIKQGGSWYLDSSSLF